MTALNYRAGGDEENRECVYVCVGGVAKKMAPVYLNVTSAEVNKVFIFFFFTIT